jgi:8-oxo-dGDP phosphatase
MTGFRLLGEQEVHRGHVWRVVVAEFEAPDGARFERDVVRSPGAVGVVPLLFDVEGEPSVVVVDQYRPAYERNIVEIPAGMRDVPGEAPEATAARELAEEVGLRAGRLDLLGEILPSPGLTDSVTTIFLATHCEPVERTAHGPEEEHMRVVQLPLAEALAMVDRGEIVDAKTVTGLLLTSRRLARADGADRKDVTTT